MTIKVSGKFIEIFKLLHFDLYQWSTIFNQPAGWNFQKLNPCKNCEIFEDESRFVFIQLQTWNLREIGEEISINNHWQQPFEVFEDQFTSHEEIRLLSYLKWKHREVFLKLSWHIDLKTINKCILFRNPLYVGINWNSALTSIFLLRQYWNCPRVYCNSLM